jgi:hypothetical protein
MQTSIGSKKVMILLKESSAFGYPGEIPQALNADHMGICKYSSRDDPNHISVRNVIASLVVKSRSKAEQQAQSSSAGFAAHPGREASIDEAPSTNLSEAEDNLEELLVSFKWSER